MKIHLFDREHSNMFPQGHKDRKNATKCGYIRDKVTTKKMKLLVNCA